MTARATRLLDAVNEITTARRVELHGRSMLDQLQADVDHDEDSSPKTGGGSAAGSYESRPPGRYAPRELLSSMAREVEVWVDWCGLTIRSDQYDTAGPRLRRTLTAMQANLGQLTGIAQQLDDDGWHTELEAMTRDLEQIGSGLRRYCGLERTFRPRVGCPNPDCSNAHRSDRDILAAHLDRHIDIRRRRPGSTITVWLDDQGRQAERARCHGCGYSWDQTEVGLLLEHIRASTSEHDEHGQELIDASAAAHHLGITTTVLRGWRNRNPELLPTIEGRGPRGAVLFRLADIFRLADTRRAISA